MKDIRCGLHSGFAWCCILSFITLWKYSRPYKKLINKWMNATEGLVNPIQHIYIKTDREKKIIIDYWVAEETSWGMIPCIFHLYLRRRNTIKSCNCLADDWKWDAGARADLKNRYPHLVVENCHE